MASPNKYTSKLKGSRVLVIGGSSGIGFGVAEALLENEAQVIISSSSPERVAKAVERLQTGNPAAKGHITGLACDLGTQAKLTSEVNRLFVEAGKGGKLDHVVFTAGDALAIGKLENFSLQEIQQAGMVRFFAPLIVAQHLRQYLKAGPAASFTITTGGNSERPSKDWAIINSYLTGLHGMTRGLALDLAPIRVNLVSPGAVETELWQSVKEAGQYEQLVEQFKSKMTTQTIGKVEDVAESYLYLMKDKNVSGSVITTNGGAFLL